MLQIPSVDKNSVRLDNTKFYVESVSVDCSEFIEEKLTDNTF